MVPVERLLSSSNLDYCAENINENLLKTAMGSVQPKFGAEEVTEPAQSDNPRLIAIRAIITCCCASDRRQWADEVLKCVQGRFKRVPRGGWGIILEGFKSKFGEQITSSEYRKLLYVHNKKHAPAGSSDMEISSKKSCDLSSFTPEAKLYASCRESFLQEIEALKLIDHSSRPRTKKIPHSKINGLLLTTMNQVIGEYIKNNPPTSMDHISTIIYAGQCAYQKLISKNYVPSKWRENMVNKIEEWKSRLEIIEKFFSKTLTTEEKPLACHALSLAGYRKKNPNERSRITVAINDKIKILEKKMSIYESRRTFRLDNQNFELNRRAFYRNLTPREECDVLIDLGDCEEFWKSIWKKRTINENTFKVDKRMTGVENVVANISNYLVDETIKFLPNWKAPGCDGVYNFFVKKFDTLHEMICNEIRKVAYGECIPGDWFYTGITYLIPKCENPRSPNDLRPITCMPSLYKLMTKCINVKLGEYVEAFNLLSENQMGTKKRCQGAKEQALINKSLNKANKYGLFSTWVDVKKAFDSVDHDFLMEVIENSGIPSWIVQSIRSLISKWRVKLKLNNNEICEIPIERGILQGDSLSPLLFVLVLDPLSRFLSEKYPKVAVMNGDATVSSFSTNHLLFIDDLKLISNDENVIVKMMEDVTSYFKAIGFEKNLEKSATNSNLLSTEAKLLDELDGYKYLGVLEGPNSQIQKSEMLKIISTEVIQRIENLVNTKLNAVNLFKAINEHALSLYNYYIGLVDIEPFEYELFDTVIRSKLIKHRIHLKPANKQRLYLPRNNAGRGLRSLSFLSEKMLLGLHLDLKRRSAFCSRSVAILQAELEVKTHLATIEEYIRHKYSVPPTTGLDIKTLSKLQDECLLAKIHEKNLHSVFYKNLEECYVNVSNSSHWLKCGNNSPRSEALYCLLQDRNLFFSESDKLCGFCKKYKKTVDHCATRCGKMLHGEYIRRHNEIVRCLHFHFCREFGLKNEKKLKTHSVQRVVVNESVEIRVDTFIKTDTIIEHNKPDLFVFDKKHGRIFVVEVGITSSENLQQVELEKLRKYDLLSKELEMIHHANVKVVPIVLTWDGLVTSHFPKYAESLNISERTYAYIQSLTLKKTLESMFVTYRNRVSSWEHNLEITRLINEMYRNFEIMETTPIPTTPAASTEDTGRPCAKRQAVVPAAVMNNNTEEENIS